MGVGGGWMRRNNSPGTVRQTREGEDNIKAKFTGGRFPG